MEEREIIQNRLNELTCLLLGKLAHIEDILDVAIPFAEELLRDIPTITE